MKKAAILTLMIFAIISMACTVSGISVDINRAEGSGVLVKENRTVDEFSEIALSSIGNLYITQGDENRVVIEAEDNIITRLTTENRGNRLVIGMERGFNLVPTREINYYVTVKDLNLIQITGAGKVEMNSLTTDNLYLNMTGLGSMEIKSLNADSLDVMISGAGDVNIAGEVVNQKVNISGAGNYRADDLHSQNASITVSGLGNSDLWVDQSLHVIISGGGNINYYGSPEIDRTITGLGKLTSQGEHH